MNFLCHLKEFFLQVVLFMLVGFLLAVCFMFLIEELL